MKKNLPAIPLFLAIISVLNSCSVNKDTTITENRTGTERSKETSTTCFVQMKDGSIVSYKSLKLVTAVFNDAYLLADGKTKVYPKDIKAYQTPEYYAVSQSIFANGRKSHVSVECLSGFGIRIAKGKLNVYCKKFYNGAHAVDEFYLQKGDDGPILLYTAKLMNELLKDNAEAANFFNSKLKNTPLNKKLQATAAIVNNNDRMLSTN